MKQIFTLVAVVGLGVYPLGADDKETKPLLGTWSATLWEDGDMSLKEADGIPLKAIITKDAFAFDAGTAKKSKYKLDFTKTPHEIDLTPEGGSKKGKTLKGIWEVKDDTLKLCLNPDEGDRPTEFAIAKGKSFVLMEFKREKK